MFMIGLVIFDIEPGFHCYMCILHGEKAALTYQKLLALQN
jgi:hypothetical protein